jgi:DNA-binding transcriptional LysR family regulator
MDLGQIRCFLSVAELESFSLTARRHFVSQPAVSLRIKALEEAVGERLVERRGNKVRLTQAGELFRIRCREAIQSLERGLSEVADLKDLKRGRLAVGAIDAAGITLLPPLLKAYHELHPLVDLVVRVEPSAPLIGALLSGQLDCAIVTLPAPAAGLDVLPLEEETLVMVAPPETGQTARPATVLQRFPLIAYPRGSVTRALIDSKLSRSGLEPRMAMELAHPEAILRMVEAGLGVAVLPERIVARSAPAALGLGADGGVRIVPGFRVKRRLGLVARKGEVPSSAARAFLELVKQARSSRSGI